jgi:hypothetical protein
VAPTIRSRIATRVGRFLGISDIARALDTAHVRLDELSRELVDQNLSLQGEERRLREMHAVLLATSYLASTPSSDEVLISVVLPTRARPRFATRAIQSVQAQSYDNWQLIVIVDGADNETHEALRRFGDSRIEVVYQEHTGPSAARTSGLEKAAGAYIAYLNDDDLMFEHWLRGVAWAFARLPDAEAVVGVCLDDHALAAVRIGNLVEPDPAAGLRGYQLAGSSEIAAMQLAHRRSVPERWHDEDAGSSTAGFLARLGERRDVAPIPVLAGTCASALAIDADGFVSEEQLREKLAWSPQPPLGPIGSEHLVRGDELWRDGRVAAALAAYVAEQPEGTGDHFAAGMAHKRIVSLLSSTQGIEGAFRHYGLERVDERALMISPNEILCVLAVLDEADRLPFFLDYYEKLGVDRFLCVDNGSQDGTRELLLQRPNVHVWHSGMDYTAANYGMAWVETLLRAHGEGHWCVIVDVDEFLQYPDVDSRSLPQLCASLDERGEIALSAVLLDMYSDGPIRDAFCAPGADPLTVCPFFDREFSHSRVERATPWQNIEGFSGGVRRRVFGETSDPFLSKVPLMRYSEDRLVVAGTHASNVQPEQMSTERGVLLHFKFTSQFAQRIEAETRVRGRRRAQGESYSIYGQVLDEQPMLSLHDPDHSVELSSSRQLVDLGIMQVHTSR